MLTLTLHGTTQFLPDADKESAMQRYWQARQGGDTTAHLKFLPGEPPEPEPDPPPPPGGAAAVVPDNGHDVAAGTVSVLAQERIALHEQWLVKAGFHLPPPLYAPGTRVLPLGDHNFRMERRRVEELPRFPEAAEKLREQIRSEQRGDLTVRLGDLSMDDSGNLEAGAFRLGLELDAFRQLAILAGFGMGARYLAEACDAQLRGENVTWQLHNRSQADREVVLRTRTQGERRSAFAVVTPTYAAVDSDEVLDLVGTPLSDAHAEVFYDGTGVRATALFLPDQVVDLAAGDVFKVGVRVETDDTGRGRIRVSAVAFRNLCLNLLIIGEGEVQTLAQVHRGDTSKIREAVREGVVQARESIGAFLESWGHARQIHVEDPADTLQRWVTTGKISVQGERDQKQTVEEFLRAWRKEPGDTLADLVNAVSRAAHEVPRWSQSTRDDLERQAGALVMAAA